MPHLGEKLKSFRLEKEWNQTQMAEFVGVSFRSYQDIEKTGKIKKSEVLTKITQKTGLGAQIPAPQDNNKETQKEAHSEQENTSGASQDISLQAIKNLTETGKIHAENYKVMVSNEAKLINLLAATVDSGKDNGVASPKVMSGILVAMAKIASGTRWHSEDEALRELGRLLSPQVDESKKSKDIHVD